jgi:hypothetical protein
LVTENPHICGLKARKIEYLECYCGEGNEVFLGESKIGEFIYFCFLLFWRGARNEGQKKGSGA